MSIPSQALHDICLRSPSLRTTVGTLKQIMDHPTPEKVWLELWPFYQGLTVHDIKKVWTTEAEKPKPRPGRWPLSLFTRKTTLP